MKVIGTAVINSAGLGSLLPIQNTQYNNFAVKGQSVSISQRVVTGPAPPNRCRSASCPFPSQLSPGPRRLRLRPDIRMNKWNIKLCLHCETTGRCSCDFTVPTRAQKSSLRGVKLITHLIKMKTKLITFARLMGPPLRLCSCEDGDAVGKFLGTFLLRGHLTDSFLLSKVVWKNNLIYTLHFSERKLVSYCS